MLAQKVQAAFALYQQGQLAAAEAAARRLVEAAPNSADTQRLLGMVLSAAGDHEQGIAALRRALALAPGHSEILNSLGLAAARSGRSNEAERAYREALNHRPSYTPARRNLASLMIADGRAGQALALMEGVTGPDFDRLRGHAHLRLSQPEAALAAFDSARIHSADDPRIALGRANALTELGQADAALAALEGLSGPDVETARARAHLEAGQPEAAVSSAAGALQSAPTRHDTLFLIAQCLWMSGRGGEIAGWFERALQAAPEDAALCRLYARTLKQMDDHEGALTILDRLASPQASDLAERADVLIEAGRGPEACEAAEAALAADADLPGANAGYARAALMTDRPEAALRSIQRMRARHPDDRFWIAMEAEAWRSTDLEAWRRLCDPETVAAAFDLPVPEGFQDIASFNSELARRLRTLHAFSAHPLDQSLRNGVQTAVDLRRVGDPVIDAFFKVAQSVVDDFIEAMPENPDHPLFSYKPAGGEIMSAWSVLLGGEGHHVSHVHPAGWISSAYYVETPDDLEARDNHEGWLVLGEPPFATPKAEPAREIAARPGRLVLFPSYLWHSTRPIRSGERLSIAFDIRPKQVRS